jgi:2',3'-cyclic-nucleotide 2'-phosphodiesterase (5'-nucleotidase family)
MMRHIIALFALSTLLVACDASKKAAGGDDGIIEIVFLQLNDVYEIAPLSDGTGGMARVAALRKTLLAKNPNTFTVLSGDFISPSVIGTLKYEGKRIRGRQMVDVMNATGIDWVVFGNHEFDYDDPNDLQARIDESSFTWFAANARFLADVSMPSTRFFKNKDGVKTDCPDEKAFVVKDADGTTVKLGVFGVLINTGRKPWVVYSDWFEAAKKSRENLRQQNADICVGLTHLAAADDIKLAGMLPDVPLLMGGHDHENQRHVVGKSVVAKADANAKTVYVHTIRYDKKRKTTKLTSELITIDDKIADDPVVAATIAKWEKIKNESLASSGFNANTAVVKLSEVLDCRESTIRFKQAPIGNIINEAMVAVAKKNPDCALFNSGSIRIDDQLTGTLNEIDIVRMLPFGGGISEVDMRGALLLKTLVAHSGNVGLGGYLQLWQLTQSDGKWLVNGAPIDPQKTYRVVMSDFLLTGAEQNMGFLKADITNAATGATNNPDVLKIERADPKNKNDLRADVRHALIAYWRKE